MYSKANFSRADQPAVGLEESTVKRASHTAVSPPMPDTYCKMPHLPPGTPIERHGECAKPAALPDSQRMSLRLQKLAGGHRAVFRSEQALLSETSVYTQPETVAAHTATEPYAMLAMARSTGSLLCISNTNRRQGPAADPKVAAAGTTCRNEAMQC